MLIVKSASVCHRRNTFVPNAIPAKKSEERADVLSTVDDNALKGLEGN